MDVLLHICCAPCAVEVVRDLEQNLSCKVSGLFYNPNIHPLAEFNRRRDCLRDYVKETDNLSVFYPQYNPKEFFEALGCKLDFPKRCRSCWELRLEKTALFAKENNFSSFTTTLLISPYQDQEVIKSIGNSLAKEYGIEFIDRNFRKLFSQSRHTAKEKNLYRQNYCGCLFSEIERDNKISTQTK
ncbi:MAG: epoxyqueuosine reductase QueH [Candidatus Saelkia tenebricola]|nr:epoxyqueuosine reductase QueH [Candidatus Saelkia tenebricola]